VLIVDAATECVLQANPAAVQLLRTSDAALIGAPVVEAFDLSGILAIQRSIGVARAAGSSDAVAVGRAGDGTELTVKVSLFNAGANSYLLVRLASTSASLAMDQSPVLDAIEGAAVGFLVTDAGLRVEYANQAFIELAEVSPLTQFLGKSLVRWLEFSEGDLAQLRHQMLKRQATTTMMARLRTERDLRREVEVCAVAVPDGEVPCWGFTIRELPRLN
jgi:PAS domain-containing protein